MVCFQHSHKFHSPEYAPIHGKLIFVLDIAIPHAIIEFDFETTGRMYIIQTLKSFGYSSTYRNLVIYHRIDSKLGYENLRYTIVLVL